MPVDVLALLTVVLVVGLLFLVMGVLLGKRLGASLVNRRWENRVPRIRRDAVARSRSVLTGQFSEQLAPYLPGFPFRPTEARFVGNPVDFIVFRGLDRKTPSEVVFVEVKSGRGGLSPVQRRLRDAIEEGRVRWMVYRAPSSPRPERLDRYFRS